MRNINIVWVRDSKSLIQSESESGYVGKWKVGEIFYDETRNRDDVNKWAAGSLLPGIRTDLGHFRDREDARKRVGQGVKHWFACLNDEPTVLKDADTEEV